MREGERYHEERRIGNGSTHHPTRRKGELCAAEHCPEFAATMRVTRSGYAVRYCYPHELEAHRRFGS